MRVDRALCDAGDVVVRAREAEHRAAEVVGCRYCLAGPGHPCTNAAQLGKPLKHPHPERLRDARASGLEPEPVQ